MSLNIRLIKLGPLVFSAGRLARLGLCLGGQACNCGGVIGGFSPDLGFEQLPVLSTLCC